MPAGEFPSGVKDFARKLDQAFAQANIDLTKFTQFGDWQCQNNYFPAGGPNCEEASEGQGAKGIDIGAYASEGEIYNGPSYGRFLTDWIYDVLRDSSDANGPGAPRVYALADMPDQFEGSQGQLGTYEIIATRINASPNQTPQREVLTFFVSGTTQGWLITQLQRSPVQFLDPSAEESVANFTAWQLWTEAAPAGPLASRWPDFRADRKVAYVDTFGALHVARADGAEDAVIGPSICGGTGIGKLRPTWSTQADRVTVPCGLFGTSGQPYVEIYDATTPGDPVVVQNVSSYSWSPTDNRIAYQTADINGDPPVAVVRMFEVDSGQDTLLKDNAILMDWPRQDEILLGLNPQSATVMGDVVPFHNFEANWYNLSTGETERVQRFDNHQQFWISAPANEAVVLGEQSNRKEAGVTLGVYDLATGQETALEGLAVSYGSDFIPQENIQTSPTSASFVWADYGFRTGVVVSEAALDGSQATLLDDHVPGFIQSLSSDGLALFNTYDPPLVLRDTKTGAETTWQNAITGAIAPIVAGRS